MRPSKPWTDPDDEGSASLEFIVTGLVMLLPLVYLVITMSIIQAGAFAVEGAARQAARIFVQSSDVAQAQASAIRAVEFALADHGVDPESISIAVTCTPDPNDCLSRGSFVTVEIELAVSLPFAPRVLGGGFPLAVPLQATATQQVSRFWGSG